MILYTIFAILTGVILWEWENDKIIKNIAVGTLCFFFCYSMLMGYYNISCSIKCDNHLKWGIELKEQYNDPELRDETLKENIANYNKKIDEEKSFNKDIFAAGIFHSNKWNNLEYITVEGE